MNIQRKFQYDKVYMGIANTIATLSYANRHKVGAIIISPDGQLISQGFNGTPTGCDNCCEIEYAKDLNTCFYCSNKSCNGCSNIGLKTKPEVLHAESNAIAKCAKYGSGSTQGSTLYVTLSPCMDCAKLIIQCGIRRVVFEEEYRDLSGIELLVNNGILVEKLNKDNLCKYYKSIDDNLNTKILMINDDKNIDNLKTIYNL